MKVEIGTTDFWNQMMRLHNQLEFSRTPEEKEVINKEMVAWEKFFKESQPKIIMPEYQVGVVFPE